MPIGGFVVCVDSDAPVGIGSLASVAGAVPCDRLRIRLGCRGDVFHCKTMADARLDSVVQCHDETYENRFGGVSGGVASGLVLRRFCVSGNAGHEAAWAVKAVLP